MLSKDELDEIKRKLNKEDISNDELREIFTKLLKSAAEISEIQMKKLAAWAEEVKK